MLDGLQRRQHCKMLQISLQPWTRLFKELTNLPGPGQSKLQPYDLPSSSTAARMWCLGPRGRSGVLLGLSSLRAPPNDLEVSSAGCFGYGCCPVSPKLARADPTPAICVMGRAIPCCQARAKPLVNLATVKHPTSKGSLNCRARRNCSR